MESFLISGQSPLGRSVFNIARSAGSLHRKLILRLEVLSLEELAVGMLSKSKRAVLKIAVVSSLFCIQWPLNIKDEPTWRSLPLATLAVVFFLSMNNIAGTLYYVIVLSVLLSYLVWPFVFISLFSSCFSFQIKVPSFSETLSALNVVQVAGGSKSLFAGECLCVF